MSKIIKIANAQGFWGDSVRAPYDMIEYGEIDYLTLDYLAEVTISIMQKQKRKDPNLGYAKDFVTFIEDTMLNLKKKNIKIITNAGGANPISCAKKIKEIANKLNVDLKIAVIKGDDIKDTLLNLVDENDTFNNIDTNDEFKLIKDKVCSANVYIDSFCIKEALSSDVDIVLCGRVTDPGLALGPMLYEFNWSKKDYDKLASGTLAGHIIECGAQCTGGNHTDWEKINDFTNIGYPIINIKENGDFYITKPPKSGGVITKYTIIEQVLYEMGDPYKYISPDVIVDFTSFNIVEKDNCVYISNVKGYRPTNTYKVSLSYYNGYKASGQLTISGPNAYLKAEKTAQIIWSRLESSNVKFEKKKTEYLGLNSCHKDIVDIPKQINEVVLRLSVKDSNLSIINDFSKEIAPVITNGPPGITGFSGGRPKAQEIIAYWPSLVEKTKINTEVEII